MKSQPLRTTVIGSYPFPSWLEFACSHLDRFGESDRAELTRTSGSALTSAAMTQIHRTIGLVIITIILGLHPLTAADLKPVTVEDFKRLQRLAEPQTAGRSEGPALKASVPGPYTLSGRLLPNDQYRDRYALTEALLPLVRRELEALVEAGCNEITVDEPSMSCYAHREDPARFVDIFNRTVEAVTGKCHLSTHLCFGNYKGRAIGPRHYAPMFPAFLEMHVDEVHVEMASREYAELELIGVIAAKKDVAVGIIDVKSYYVESVADVKAAVQACLEHARPERLSFAPDCGLSQTARWAARQKLRHLCEGVRAVRKDLMLTP